MLRYLLKRAGLRLVGCVFAVLLLIAILAIPADPSLLILGT